MVESSESATTSSRSPGTYRRVLIGGKIRTVRVPDDLWEAAQEAAAKNGETLSEVIRRALEEYVAQSGEHPPK